MSRREVTPPAGTPAAVAPLPADVRTAGPPPPTTPGGWRSTLAGGLLRSARPKQWLKNVLVFAAPGAAGVLDHGRPLARAGLAFIIFCLVASGVYFLNDVLDLSADRLHPTKKFRPVAAGVVGVRAAEILGALLVVSGIGLGAALGWKFVVIVAAYVAVQSAYSLWLKREPILDLAAVAAGFVLRAIAGGAATGVPISEWFLIVAMFGSLFMVAGKRSAEYRVLGEERAAHRATLALYTPSFLRFILMMSSTVAVTAYCLWAFENQKASHGGIWFQLSIVPFALAMLRYAFLLDRGLGGSPEDVVLGDRSLQVLGLLWVAIFALGVYG